MFIYRDHEKIFITVPQAQKGYKIKGFTGVLEETPAAIQLQEALDFQEKKEQNAIISNNLNKNQELA